MKNSIKRAQSRAGSSFAERENFRPKVKHLKRKLMMTLALLITAATSAWAESKPIGLNVEYEVGDKITSTTEVYVWYGIYQFYGQDPQEMAIKITSSVSPAISKLGIVESSGLITLDSNYDVYDMSGNTKITDDDIQCQGVVTGTTLEKVHVASGSGTLTDPYVFAPGPASSGNAFPINWSATSPNTASIEAMPAGNVTVNVKYFAQAEFAKSSGETPELLAPAAIADVPANTDAPIVTAGTVANIGTSEVKQGTLKYFVSQTAMSDAELQALTPDKWSENVPTANGRAEGKAYVWYYIEGAEPAQGTARTDDNTRSDSDIMPLGSTGFVTLLPEPTYTVSLNKTDLAEGEPAKWSAKSTNVTTAVNLGEADLEGVKKSETVTVTYSGTKKIIGVKAEKKAALTYPIALSAVTEEYIGSVVATDGNVYATAADAIAASETAVAMIAYVGTESDCDHGLAIALADESGGQKVYSAASTACSGKASVAGRTWRLPSQKDWQYMFIGCGSGESYSEPTGTTIKSYTALTDKLTTASGDAFKTGDSDSYWTSTVRVSGESMWIISFWGSDAYVPFGASFGGGILTGSSHVRACLAF